MPAPLKTMADAIRVLAMDAVEQANSGHPGMPMGMADVATVLWTRFLKYDAARPDWADRDRFVLSAGHGSMLLYALLHLSGAKAMTMQKLMVNQALANMGLQTTQMIATLFDGITRHTREGLNFKRRAAEEGWKQAVAERDQGTFDWTTYEPIKGNR